MDTMRRVVINVIGTGDWGPNLIRNFSSNINSRVGMICDIDPRRLGNVSRRYPDISATEDSDVAIQDPEADAIAIVTPLRSHYSLARKALLAGKDVLAEKPLAATVDECEELIQLAEQGKRILMIGHVFKFNPGIRYVKQILESNEIGKIISIHAIRTNLGPVRHDVNALWDLGSHDLSILHYWLSQEPTQVTASGVCHLSADREDMVTANYSYPNNIMATLLVSWLHPRKVREITIVGENKMVVWNDMDLVEPVRIYDKGVERSETFGDTFGAFRLALREGNITVPPVRGHEPLALECDHFIQCVRNREKPIADGLEGKGIVRALLAADESIRNSSMLVPIS